MDISVCSDSCKRRFLLLGLWRCGVVRFYDGCDVLGAAVAHLDIVFVKQLFQVPRVKVFLDKM